MYHHVLEWSHPWKELIFLNPPTLLFMNSDIMLVYFVLKLHQLKLFDGIQNRIGNDDRSDQSFY